MRIVTQVPVLVQHFDGKKFKKANVLKVFHVGAKKVVVLRLRSGEEIILIDPP
jgi:hypothetical protein